MKVDVLKELGHASSKRLEGIEKFNEIDEVKLLLEHNSAQERAVLRNFGLDDSLVRVEEERGKLMEIENFRDQYGNAFQIEAIRELAIRFGMKFLPLTRFKGAVDPLLANKMLAFGEKHGIDTTHSGVQDQFYVLAPKEEFHLTTEVHKNTIRHIVSVDPLLFYRGDFEGNDNRDGKYWTLVHQWGTDFNWGRMLRATPLRNARTLWLSNALAYSAIAFLAITLLFSTFTFSPLVIMAIATAIGCLGSCMRSSNITDSEAKNMFSENNWSDDRYHVDVTEHITEYRNRF